MSNRYLIIFVGLILIAIGVTERGWALLAIWLGADFVAVGIARAHGGDVEIADVDGPGTEVRMTLPRR